MAPSMALISITWPVLAVGATRAPVMYSTLLRSLADGSHVLAVALDEASRSGLRFSSSSSLPGGKGFA
jgi:hypothetical protein